MLWRRSSRLTLIAYLGLAPAGRTRDLIMSRRAPTLSLFILVVLVIIAESNPILHAPEHSRARLKYWIETYQDLYDSGLIQNMCMFFGVTDEGNLWTSSSL
jgi:hypothetical protein